MCCRVWLRLRLLVVHQWSLCCGEAPLGGPAGVRRKRLVPAGPRGSCPYFAHDFCFPPGVVRIHVLTPRDNPTLPKSTQLLGEYPKHNMSAEWISRHLARLDLEVHSLTLFPAKHSYENMSRTTGEARDWIDELDSSTPPKTSGGVTTMC